MGLIWYKNLLAKILLLFVWLKLSPKSIMVASFSIPYFFVNKWLFTLMPFCAGFLSMILNSAPFLLIEIYRKKADYPKTRGLANDNSCVTLSCKSQPNVRVIKYTGCTLKLRAVKLLFVIFGRLSYTFFGKNMVLSNGRLSYIIWKNYIYFTKLIQNMIIFWWNSLK